MKNVWILQINWTFNDEGGHEIIKVIDDEQKAKNEFRKFLVKEYNTSWLSDFIDNTLNPIDDMKLDEYDISDTYFLAAANESRTEIWIESFIVE